jgi:hypothetical protein
MSRGLSELSILKRMDSWYQEGQLGAVSTEHTPDLFKDEPSFELEYAELKEHRSFQQFLSSLEHPLAQNITSFSVRAETIDVTSTREADINNLKKVAKEEELTPEQIADFMQSIYDTTYDSIARVQTGWSIYLGLANNYFDTKSYKKVEPKLPLTERGIHQRTTLAHVYLGSANIRGFIEQELEDTDSGSSVSLLDSRVYVAFNYIWKLTPEGPSNGEGEIEVTFNPYSKEVNVIFGNTLGGHMGDPVIKGAYTFGLASELPQDLAEHDARTLFGSHLYDTAYGKANDFEVMEAFLRTVITLASDYADLGFQLGAYALLKNS